MEATAKSPRGLKVNTAADKEKAQFGELQQHLNASIQVMEKLLIMEPMILSRDPTFADIANHLEVSKANMLNVLNNIDNFLKNRVENRRETIKQILANPLIVQTTQAQKFLSPEGKLELRAMSDSQLYEFFMAEPMTKDTRKEAELLLRKRFSKLPLSVIRRILVANRFQLAQSSLQIDAWQEANCPNEFYWTSPSGKSSKCRMIYDYEREEMMKRSRSPQKLDELFSMELSLSTIIQLQYLCVKNSLN